MLQRYRIKTNKHEPVNDYRSDSKHYICPAVISFFDCKKMNSMMRFIKCLCCLIFISIGWASQAQEIVTPLQENKVIKARSVQPQTIAQKPTSLTIPFFEDFTDNDPYPNASRWADKEVYINNTMSSDMISRGLATFDALNDK